MVARLEVEARRLADDRHDHGVLVGVAVGRVLGRRVRHAVEQRLELLLRLGQLAPRAAAARSLTAVSSSSCSGVGLPFSFVRARSSSTSVCSARQRSSAREQLVEDARPRPCARARRERRRGRRGLRGGRSSLVESRSASSTCATPSSAAGGQIQSATAFTRVVRVLDGDAEAGPLDELDVVLAVAERDRLLAA